MDQCSISVEVRIHVPKCPNFVRTLTGEVFSLTDISDDELKKIGAEWTDNLLRHAADLRLRKDAPKS